MHRQNLVRPKRQVLLAQPIDQCGAIGRLQQAIQRVHPFGSAVAKSHSQSMQIVVAQHTLHTALQGHQAAQHAGGSRAAIDQITQHDQMVTAG